jgi:16S rRNA (uracil1498-N3)-methyltransferase
VGVDRIVPVIGDRSERKVYKTDRAFRIALSATKQSLKSRIPEIAEPVSVKDFICHSGIPSPVLPVRNDSASCDSGPAESCHSGPADSCDSGPADSCHSEPAEQAKESLWLIACCFEGDKERVSIQQALQSFGGTDVTILIGPEGDFSPEEVRLAIGYGYIPVLLGASRLRTETAAVLAATAVYLNFE